MGLRSPFGNGPQSLTQPVPGAQTMGQMYSQMPSQMPQRSPAAAPSPMPSPSPATSNGMSAQEMNDLQGISAQELADLKELDAGKETIGDKVVSHVKNHYGEIVGATLGGLGGAALGTFAAPGVGTALGETSGAAVGGAFGQKIQNYVEGKPQPSLGESLTTGAMNAAGVATVGGLARIAGGAASGFAKEGVKAAAESALGAEAAQVAKGRLADAEALGVPALSFQTGQGSVLGSKAEAEGLRVAAGDRGVVPQAELMSVQAQQEAGIQARLNQIKEMFGAQRGRTPQPGEKMGHLNDELQPHEFAQNWLDRYHGMIGSIKGKAQEIFKDRQFDATQLMSSLESALKKNNIIDDMGRPTAKVADLMPDEKQLFNTWKSLGNATSRKSSFGEAGGQVPSPQANSAEAFSHANESMAGAQPFITPKISLLPPNESGPSNAGISFNLLDNIVSKIQKIAATGRKNVNKSYLQESWNDISKDATTAFHDVIREHLAPVDPESANMLARVDKLYSGYADNVKDMAGQIRENPSAAANVFVDKANPAATKQAFHVLPQEQGDVIRRQILAQEFEKAMTTGTSKASAQVMLDGLKAYGNENLETVFGNQRGDVMNALGAMVQLQKTQITPAARAANLLRLEDAASKSGIIRQGMDLFNAMVSNNKELQRYIGSPDFQAKVLRKSQLVESRARSTAVQAGKNAAGSGVSQVYEKLSGVNDR